jgi:hypothetical protein
VIGALRADFRCLCGSQHTVDSEYGSGITVIMPTTGTGSHLQRLFWWLWGSLFATVCSLLLLQSIWLMVPSMLSSLWALQRLLQSQLLVDDTNDLDLEMQPLEHAGVTPQRRNLTLSRALRQAFARYLQEGRSGTIGVTSR